MADAALVGTVGRKCIRLALTNGGGELRTESIRSYDVTGSTGLTATMMGFQRDLALTVLPRHAAIAVAGPVRGDSISVTNTRIIVSQSGLSAMLGAHPLVLNDFAAEAWGLSGGGMQVIEKFGAAAPDLLRSGCYLVVGITSGFGASAVVRHRDGSITVLPTEAGHGTFSPVTAKLADLLEKIFPTRHSVAIEEIVSAPGLVAIYNLMVQRTRQAVCASTPEEVTRLASSHPAARTACETLAEAFWAQVGSLVVTFGAWDGVLVTGDLARAILPFLRTSTALACFTTSSGQHKRVLQQVPRALVTKEHAELTGMAAALRHEQTTTPRPLPLSG